MTNPMEAAEALMWAVLAVIAVVAVGTGGFVFWLSDSGIAGLSTTLAIAALGLLALRYL